MKIYIVTCMLIASLVSSLTLCPLAERNSDPRAVSPALFQAGDKEVVIDCALNGPDKGPSVVIRLPENWRVSGRLNQSGNSFGPLRDKESGSGMYGYYFSARDTSRLNPLRANIYVRVTPFEGGSLSMDVAGENDVEISGKLSGVAHSVLRAHGIHDWIFAPGFTGPQRSGFVYIRVRFDQAGAAQKRALALYVFRHVELDRPTPTVK